ncbi:hypothetical protein FC15_GL000856 [Lapidilactobacillus concavus DSM 17758]|uniref:Uncharacterized protein n=1 Tax=Lapidilactobacillus concavus DSM 17758 TaxID=1423735 RepID=A0A0R1W0K6_9LACO|nr:hypothetical protein FC15_GL000856 [Lapidilactobacillus concavus DSM 17758]
MFKQAFKLKTFWLFLIFLIMLVAALNVKPINWNVITICIPWLIVIPTLIPVEHQHLRK